MARQVEPHLSIPPDRETLPADVRPSAGLVDIHAPLLGGGNLDLARRDCRGRGQGIRRELGRGAQFLEGNHAGEQQPATVLGSYHVIY